MVASRVQACINTRRSQFADSFPFRKLLTNAPRLNRIVHREQAVDKDPQLGEGWSSESPVLAQRAASAG
jgi:hypothetical protein